MKKFPVVSENGNEYFVKIRNMLGDSYEVGVYVKKRTLGITWNSQINYELVIGAPWYTGRKYDYDFKRMAIKEINRIEAELAEDKLRAKLIKHNAKKFAEWDGDCR